MKTSAKKEDNLIIILINKFLPYWPLFLVLLVICLIVARVYLQYTTPLFEASASILIDDAKKGSDESKLSESLDYLSSKKIVENEIEVLKSKSLVKQIVNKLNLYAPVFEEGKLKAKLLYENGPITVEYQQIDTLTKKREINFKYSRETQEVIIDAKVYPTNEWVKVQSDVFRFTPNPNYKSSDKPLFFTIMSPRSVANQLAGRLNVASVSKLSSVVRISIMDQSPKRAEDILRELLNGYNRLLTDEKNALAAHTSTFVEERLMDIKQDLDSIEQKIQQYKSSNGALDISSQGQLFLENVSSNDQKLSEINMQLAVLKHLRAQLLSKNNVGGIVPSTLGVSDPLLSQLLNKLYDAEMNYEKLKKTTAENNPILVSIVDEINKIKPSILENIDSQTKSLQASKNNLYATNNSYSTIMEAIPQKERDLVDISREHSTKSNIYNFLLQRREEAALSYSGNTLTNKVIDEPESSTGPVSPNHKLIYAFAVFFSLGAGAGLILGKELLSGKILYRYQIENLTNFPVVSEISYEKEKKELVISNRKNGVIAEQFRKLRASLSYIGIVGNRKKLLITSAIPGEGKSFISANLGLTLALGGKRVILLELDLSNPSLSNKLGIPKKEGMTSFLEGKNNLQDIIVRTPAHKNLFIIPSGTLPENPTELIMNGRVEKLFEYLEENFDYIIVDTAPVCALSDAYILSPLCDATLYIVRHNYTPKAILERLDENNKINELKNLTILFNSIQSRGFSKNTYGYGYSYSYANKAKLT
ncbi:polysaccharide biosynthesis tyrosine autokinase [Chryseolinea sp. H1M3-3]|uniref:GumC family protein n=1 Tax=Chryseolinea sp. H1M3-3 TaxID=3034144 RepID=UPI0023ED23EE|nr:polysaccharide biosynthesis tyrosine autokinase [Chryseolinea sp. H1M3-3]